MVSATELLCRSDAPGPGIAAPWPVTRYSTRELSVPSGTCTASGPGPSAVVCDPLNSGITASTFRCGGPGTASITALTFQPPFEPLT
ncbi:hypothetical protein [Sorangium cellulosum]|uniref:hypothetical protein n=1 Tax=Sorangium cellulosum TaxID=56 RepID=UPI0012DB0CAE|nr:hypothetical protein [Sorangium cellulosum]